MDTTTNNKINVGADAQIMDWAKPYYNVSPNTATNQVQLKAPQETITVDSLKQVPDIKVPKTPAQNNTVVGEIVSTTQPSIQQAQKEFNQVQQAAGTEAKDARQALNELALDVFGKKAQAQSNQVNIENQLGLQEQQKALSQINTEIANEQVALRNEEEKLRQSFGSEAQKQISRNTLNDTFGRRLADLAIRQSAANQNITAIQANAERQTKLLTAPLDTKIQYLSTFAKDNVDYLNDEQKTKISFLTNNLESQKKDIQALQSAKTQMIMEIAENGGGSNTQLIAKIQNAKNMGEVTSIGATSGFVGKLDRQLKQAQLSKIYQDMAESRATNAAKEANLVLNAPKAAAIQGEIIDIKSLSRNPGIQTAVGTTGLARSPSGIAGTIGKALTGVGLGGLVKDLQLKVTGDTQNFIAGVEKIREQTTLDALTKAKENGLTFGSLTEGERNAVGRASSKLSSWAIIDDNGKVTGYNTTEKAMANELNTLAAYKALDYVYRGGNPSEVGSTIMSDGVNNFLVVANADGTYSEVPILNK